MHSRKILSALILGCCLVTRAYAQPGEIGEIGEVQFKDMSAGTLTISARVYRVTPETQLRDREGQPTTLAEIDAPQRGEKGLWEMLYAHYVGVETSAGHRLTSFELLRHAPE